MDQFFKDIPIFEWDDLDGKTLLIRVSEDGGHKFIHGYDPINNIIYVLAEQIITMN